MNVAKYDEWTQELEANVNLLARHVKNDIPLAKEILAKREIKPNSPSPEQVAEMQLWKIPDIIRAIMMDCEKLYEAAGIGKVVWDDGKSNENE